MCGRYALDATAEDLIEGFKLLRKLEWTKPRYNIAPTQQVLGLRFDEEATPREPVRLKWGLIPSWAKDAKIGNSLINARGDTVATKPSFRAAFKKRRCLIPATGFYEWLRIDPKNKQPFLIAPADGRLMAFAGLWEYWDKGDEPIESCTIITTDANEPMTAVHDRMPVILDPDDYDRWLDPASDPAALQELLRPAPDDFLTFTKVSTVVNNARNERPECVVPLEGGTPERPADGLFPDTVD
jgi:putative SOS response-associated peptidase YedK